MIDMYASGHSFEFKGYFCFYVRKLFQWGSRKPVLFFSFCMVLFGCSTQFDIVVSSVGGGAVFEFSKTISVPPSERRDVIGLNSFCVITKAGDRWDYRNPLWSFETRPGAYVKVGLIRYGHVPEGFQETRPPEKLLEGIHYRAVAFGEGGGGKKDFSLEQLEQPHRARPL